MKENIKLVLLVIITGTLIFIAIDQHKALAPVEPVTFTPTPPKASSDVFPEAKRTFDPLTPPTQPVLPPPEYSGPPTGIAFKTATHDFGIIEQNSVNKYTFQFTNTGKDPLVITNAIGSCGCTVPDYPKHPIAPGETGDINVVYKPGMQEGLQNKTVTVTANTDPVQTVLRISADVHKTE